MRNVLIDVFAKSGLFMEFMDTLITNCMVPQKLRRQIWLMCSMDTGNGAYVVWVNAIAQAFADSMDDADLRARWQKIVARAWPTFPDCEEKTEIDCL